MTTPPDFGGRAVEQGVQEDLGVPVEELEGGGLSAEGGIPDADHEAHAPGQVCALCGAAIKPGEDVRRRLDGQWVHEICP